MANYEMRQASMLACAMGERAYRNQSMATRPVAHRSAVTSVAPVQRSSKVANSQYMKNKLRDECRSNSMISRGPTGLYRNDRSATAALMDNRH